LGGVRAQSAGRARAIRLGLIILVVGGALVVSLLVFRRGASPGEPRSNVVLIILDTVRADRLGCYGSKLGLTPNIDDFAGQSVLFEHAFSQAPWTLPSIASIFTSRYPVQHGAGGRLGDFTVLGEDEVTLAEVFRDAGAETGEVTNVLFLTQAFGMTQGFQWVDAAVAENNTSGRRAEGTTKAALEWLGQRRDERFFLFVHYFDAHLTYDPPQPYRRRFADPRDAETGDYLFGSVRDMVRFRRGEVTLDSDKIRRLERLYDGEVAYVDDAVGELLKGMSGLGLDKNTIVVLTADHGEEFGDHGGFEHGHTLYDELLRVPLIVRLPKHPGKRGPLRFTGRVGTGVRLIDIAPTVCQLAGVRVAGSFAGRSLLPLLEGRIEPDRPVLSMGNMWGPSGIAWRSDGFKLVKHVAGMRYQLFEVKDDPEERRDLAPGLPWKVKEMAADLGIALKKLSAGGKNGAKPELSEKEIERLRSLGYVR